MRHHGCAAAQAGGQRRADEPLRASAPSEASTRHLNARLILAGLKAACAHWPHAHLGLARRDELHGRLVAVRAQQAHGVDDDRIRGESHDRRHAQAVGERQVVDHFLAFWARSRARPERVPKTLIHAAAGAEEAAEEEQGLHHHTNVPLFPNAKA